jgi:hypothetical protein
MKQNESYHRWVQARRQVDIDPHFADRVMSRLSQRPARTCESVLARFRLTQRIGASSWAKAAAIGIASIIGIGRVILTLHVLLFA